MLSNINKYSNKYLVCNLLLLRKRDTNNTKRVCWFQLIKSAQSVTFPEVVIDYLNTKKDVLGIKIFSSNKKRPHKYELIKCFCKNSKAQALWNCLINLALPMFTGCGFIIVIDVV